MNRRRLMVGAVTMAAAAPGVLGTEAPTQASGLPLIDKRSVYWQVVWGGSNGLLVHGKPGVPLTREQMFLEGDDSVTKPVMAPKGGRVYVARSDQGAVAVVSDADGNFTIEIYDAALECRSDIGLTEYMGTGGTPVCAT